MSDLRDHQNKTQSVFLSSLEWFANFTAVVITFFGTPIVYNSSAPFVRDFAQRHYHPDVVWIADGCWFFVVAGLIFFGSRATTSTLILSGGIVLAARLWA